VRILRIHKQEQYLRDFNGQCVEIEVMKIALL